MLKKLVKQLKVCHIVHILQTGGGWGGGCGGRVWGEGVGGGCEGEGVGGRVWGEGRGVEMGACEGRGRREGDRRIG